MAGSGHGVPGSAKHFEYCQLSILKSWFSSFLRSASDIGCNPNEVTDTSRWLAGSTEPASLRAWLAEHGEDLHWVEAAGEYHLAGTAGG